MADRPVPAVLVERACKYYGRPNKQDYKPVLTNLNMTVERGHIYGLLGPSGCGKTTLLSCIVGRRKLDSGDIWVLGGRPGEKGSGVPGPRVGYMPQEVALVGEFTIRDAIYYFGRIYGMGSKLLGERYDFLSNLLELGNGGKLVKHLSGGQQRRVSLAAALVHEPELLILDEPCVGLDPVLRERIWGFLSELARGGTTVIITTHYIDETKQANKIGLLRDGQLLAENSPSELLEKFNVDTLEDAFFKLALRQDEAALNRPSLVSSPDVIPETSTIANVESRYQSKEDFNVVTSSTDVLTKEEDSRSSKIKSRARYKAVFIKSIQQFSRHPGGLIFSILFPIIQVVSFFMAVGHDPRDLHLAVVNDEAARSIWGPNVCKNTSIPGTILDEDDRCELNMLSCWFLDEMEKHKIFVTPYNNTNSAIEAVKVGQLYGAMHFHQNFSEALGIRVREGEVPDDIVDQSTISIWLDSTNHQIAYFLKTQLHKTYESFTKKTMKACNRPEKLVDIPVHFHEPIYGVAEAKYVAFMAPGVMITIVFFLAAIVTSTLMISDRMEGVWERSAVAGVKPHEMLNVHIVIQTAVIVIQTLELILLSFYGYGLVSKGSLITASFLIFMQGLSGMCYGFLLSVCCANYTISFFLTTGSFYPMILLCGILWPLEAMSAGLRAVALALPFTIPSLALRNIMEKGYTIDQPEIYHGFLVTIAWIVLSLSVCFIVLRLKKS